MLLLKKRRNDDDDNNYYVVYSNGGCSMNVNILVFASRALVDKKVRN
jgi:hypothetical protein